MVGTDSSLAQLVHTARNQKVTYARKCVYVRYEGRPLFISFFFFLLEKLLFFPPFHYVEICSGLVFGRWRISLTK